MSPLILNVVLAAFIFYFGIVPTRAPCSPPKKQCDPPPKTCDPPPNPCAKKEEGCSCQDYIAPGTAKYPLGDEEINHNMLEPPGANEMKSKADPKKFAGKCPPTPSGDLKDTHTPCAGKGPGVPKEILYSSNAEITPQVQCKKCDLKITPDGTAVIVRCFECFDIPPPDPKNRKERDLTYLVYFVAIANYTAVSWSGVDQHHYPP